MHEFFGRNSRQNSGPSLFARPNSQHYLTKPEVAILLKSVEQTLDDPAFVVSEDMVSRFMASVGCGSGESVTFEDVYYPLKALLERRGLN